MVLTQDIYNQLNVNKNVVVILLSLLDSCFIGCLVFSSISIMLSLSSSGKLSVSLSTSISYWILVIGIVYSSFVTPDTIVSLNSNKR